MHKQWAKDCKGRIREREKREVRTAEISKQPFLTREEAAARLGISPATLLNWIYRGMIPKPKKWGRQPRKRLSKRPFRRAFVEAVREAIIIRNSNPEYRTLAAFKKLCHKMAWGYR